MSDPIAFGRWLQDRRRALDLTQRELAQQVGCSTVTIHKLETGALHPSKDIAERLAICLQIPPQAHAAFVRFARTGHLDSFLDVRVPSAVSVSQPLHNLPFPATQLIGREADLAAVRKRLRDGARLVTLVGPPGIGKTRLALELAYQSLSTYEDGVFFVPLAALSDPARVAKAIGGALNVAEARARPMTEQIKIRLRERQALLVLDNLEQVIGAAPFVADLLTGCPWLTILATSRQALRIRGERLYAVPALVAPPPQLGSDHRLTAAEALTYTAVALFVERAETALPGFPFDDAAAEAVAEICRRLDGVPLAIELVAAHANLFSPAELLARWTGPWILASEGPRDAPARQQTLYAAIDWSYRLLDDHEQALLRQLAVFAGGADLAAIEAVGGCHGLDDLDSLVEQSLVKRITGPEAERRFVLLEIIREYALARLAECDEEFTTRLKHASYYQRLAAEGRVGLGGLQQSAWFERLERERKNLHTALEWALQRDPIAERSAVTLGARLAADLYGFWWLNSHLREGLIWLERALDAAGCYEDWPAIPELWWKAGACAGYLGLGRKSDACFAACIAASRTILERLASDTPAELGSSAQAEAEAAKRALAHGLELRAFFDVKREDLGQARADLDQAVAILREVGNDLDLGHALTTHGHWAGRNGELEAARTALDESMALFRRAGNLHGSVMALGDLVRAYEYAGDFDGASRCWIRESLPLNAAEEHGEALRVHVAAWWLCYLAAGDGDEERRLGVFRKAVALQYKLGYQSFVDGSLYEPVYLALQAGMLRRAVRLAGGTKVWLAQLGLPLDDPPHLAETLAHLRLQLGEAAFDLAWAEGRAMTITESAAYALSGEE